MSGFTFFYITAALTGLLILVTCGVWLRYDLRVLPVWRRRVLSAGVVAACANVAVFVALQIYVTHRSIVGLQLWDVVSDRAGVPLVAVAFCCALAGKGKARLPLAILAGLGLMIWIPPAVL